MTWDGKPKSGAVGRLAVEPELYRQPVVLEVYYTVLPGRLEETVLGAAWLRPVLLPRAIFLGPVRWQVETAPGVLPLLLSEGYTRESRWGWHGWLWGPSPAADAAELDQWLLAGFGRAGARPERTWPRVLENVAGPPRRDDGAAPSLAARLLALAAGPVPDFHGRATEGCRLLASRSWPSFLLSPAWCWPGRISLPWQFLVASRAWRSCSCF